MSKINVICEKNLSQSQTAHLEFDRRSLELSCTEPHHNIRLPLQEFQEDIRRNLSKLNKDLIEIASFVYTADRMKVRPPMGWTRNLNFLIPVRELKIWNKNKSLLEDTLSFLMGDNITFTFIKKTQYSSYDKTTTYQQLLLKEENYDLVCLFSGGLDSFAGAAHSILEKRNPILVSHYVKVKSIQKKLAEHLKNQFSQEYKHVQFGIFDEQGKDLKSKENSQRSRSFLYLVLGVVVANEMDVKEVWIPENGIFSYNIPLSPDRMGSQTTRTTHPAFINKFEILISNLYASQITIKNPFRLLTKSEIIKIAVDAGLKEAFKDSVSCFYWPRRISIMRSKTRKDANHCGVCLPCIIRRVSMRKLGLIGYDDDYHYDIFSDISKSEKPSDYKMILDFAKFYNELSKTDEKMIPIKFVNFTTTVEPTEIADLVKLYKRFSKEVKEVLIDSNKDLKSLLK